MKIISKGKPASQIKPVRADSKKALILKATLKGITTEDIMKLTGWAKSAASSAIATDRQARGTYHGRPNIFLVGSPFCWRPFRRADPQARTRVALAGVAGQISVITLPKERL
jgi:hypothetical protein